ncbi:MAG: glycosyltransferase family 4 protein [Gemmatimonadota bacterium]
MLLVAPQPLFDDRGTPIAVRQVLEALSELGYRVDVLTYPMGRRRQIPCVRLLRALNPFGLRRVPVGFSLRKVLLDSSLVVGLAGLLSEQHYLCVHAVEEAAFPALLLARRRGIPVIYDMQSSLPEQLRLHPLLGLSLAQRVIVRLERWLLTRADLIVSSAGLSSHVRHVKPDANVREWRFPGVHLDSAPAERDELRRSLGIADGARVVLYGGTFQGYQGLPELLEAVPLVRCRAPDTVFVLVGGESGDTIRGWSEDASDALAGAVVFVRRQPKERMAAFLSMADVLVSPRAWGGNVPLKVFDYLASGRPIVATDIRSHRAVLTEERALLVRPTASGLAGGILDLLSDPARAARLGDAARAYADARLAWPTFVSSVGELYDDARALRTQRGERD